MEKTAGRNTPCPCGSGKKYKACCLRADEERARAARPKVTEPERTPTPQVAWADVEWDDDGLDDVSNSVIDLIKAGRLDEAERACHELKKRWPDMIDWRDRFAALHEARGEDAEAARHYRMAAEYARTHEDFDEDGIRDWHERADRLDPPA